MEPINATAAAETFTSNAFLVPGEQPTLVDAGAMDGVADVLEEHVNDLEAVLITHQDADHVAALKEVVEAFDPAVYAYADHDYRTHQLADGDRVPVGNETAEVVFTPGHGRDHVAFLTDTRLFSGDAVVYNDAAFDDGSFGKTDRPTDDRERLIDSIRELLDRMDETVEGLYAGHGDAFHGDVQAVVERALERAERREPKYPD
ncbi:MBL fold metallo-hydrolase [Halosegnis sp.]|uniref:MBL fold metallo-hydrolase n=1 Tax=Halosegnis sp. TaxID=2864959 RepID=UPI0035D3D99C